VLVIQPRYVYQVTVAVMCFRGAILAISSGQRWFYPFKLPLLLERFHYLIARRHKFFPCFYCGLLIFSPFKEFTGVRFAVTGVRFPV
jgi:hypothetical protein